MLRLHRGIILLVAAVAGIALGQQTRQIDDAALKTGSRTGEEW